jgi:DNA-binding MarR family transcriptional regulator
LADTGKQDYFDLILDKGEEARRPVTRVFRHVMLISRFFNEVIDETAERHDLQRGEYLVLMTLHRNDTGEGMRPTELYRSLLVTSGAVTKRLDRLAELGLVERVSHGGDGRSSPVRLTRKGIAVAKAVRKSRNRMHDVADVLGAKDLERLDQLLASYLAAIAKITAEHD